MGPCLCGDPYCSSCGDPRRAEIEEAENICMEAFAEECFDASEYEIAKNAGLLAVKKHRSKAASPVAADDVLEYSVHAITVGADTHDPRTIYTIQFFKGEHGCAGSATFPTHAQAVFSAEHVHHAVPRK